MKTRNLVLRRVQVTALRAFASRVGGRGQPAGVQLDQMEGRQSVHVRTAQMTFKSSCRPGPLCPFAPWSYAPGEQMTHPRGFSALIVSTPRTPVCS